MAWTAPTIRNTGDLITSSIWNIDLKDNLDYLKLEQGYRKNIWVPVHNTVTGAFGTEGYYATQVLTPTDEGHVNFNVPAGFTAIVTAQMIIIPKATDGTWNLDIYSVCAAIGELDDTHTDSDLATTYPLVAETLYGVDFSGILTAMAAGDFCGVVVLNSDGADTIEMLGFYMTYS